MFRASASNHRQHKHPSCRPCYRHMLYQYAFALKSSESRTKNVLEWLETRKLLLFKKLRIKTTIRIVHTTSMHKQLMTTFKIHSPPTNNSVDNNWKREHTGSHFVQKIRKLSKQTIICLKALRYQTSHGIFTPFTNSEHNDMNTGNVIKKKS